MANYSVSRNSDGDWKIRRDLASRISEVAPTQRDAEIEAKRLAGNSGGGEVRIHGLDGRIRDSDTVKPANDPFPPRDSVH